MSKAAYIHLEMGWNESQKNWNVKKKEKANESRKKESEKKRGKNPKILGFIVAKTKMLSYVE